MRRWLNQCWLVAGSNGVAATVLALVVLNVAVLYGAGHPLHAYLTANADLLYLPALFTDLLSRGGRLSDWFLTPAPYFFPDYFVYLVAHVAGPGTSSRIAIFAVLQVLLTAAAFWALAASVVRRYPFPVAVAIAVLLVWFGINGGEPFVLLFASASHFGAFLSTILVFGLWLRQQDAARRETRSRGLVAAMCGIAFLASLSDNFFLIYGIVPLLAAVAARPRRAERWSWQRRAGVVIFWGGLTLILPLLVLARPVSPPVINVAWSPQISAGQRAALEARYQLSEGDFRGDQLWTYRIADTSIANVRALVQDPNVADTHHVDRTAYKVDGATTPFIRAMATMPAGMAAAALAMLAIGYLARLGADMYRRRWTSDTFAALLVSVSAALGYASYGLIVTNPTRYAPSFGVEKAYANVSTLFEVFTRAAAEQRAYGAVAGAYVLTLIVLAALGRRRSDRSHDRSLTHAALYSGLSLLAVLVAATLMTDLPVMPRYLIPAFVWPVAIVSFAACEFSPARSATVGGILSALLVTALSVQAYRLAEVNGLRDYAYSDQLACIDAALGQAGAREGIAQYWDAKHAQEFSHWPLSIAPHLGNLEPEPWISSKRWFKNAYDFAIIDEDAEPSYRISAEALIALNGPPEQIVACGSKSLYIYGRGRLKTATAGLELVR